MANFKRTLKTAGAWCIAIGIVNILSLLLNIFVFDFSVADIVYDSIYVALSLSTGIIYLCFSQKDKQTILKYKSMFFVLSILNIFNGIIAWILCFWVQISLNKEVRNEQMKTFFNNQSQKPQNEENVIDIDEQDYEIKRSAETLASTLEDLKTSYEKNLISEEEYEKLRSEAIKKFMTSSK